MTQILCAIDDSEHSKPALDLAAKLSKALKADLTILAVNQVIGGYSRSGPPASLWSDAEADGVLQAAAGEAKSAGASNVKTVCVESRDLPLAITHYAENNGIDHIVVGNGGKGAISRMMLGSVSRDVMARAHCPVTVAR
jgi:nucleotide-binding universal stress UspA family protein